MFTRKGGTMRSMYGEIDFNAVLSRLADTAYQLDELQITATYAGQPVTITIPLRSPEGFTISVGPPEGNTPDRSRDARAIVFAAVTVGLAAARNKPEEPTPPA